MSPKQVIRQIVQRELTGLSLIESVVNREAPGLVHSGCEHFGTWWAALHYAGIDVRKQQTQQTYGRGHVLRWMKSKAHESKLRSSAYARRQNSSMHRAALKHFGSWSKALLAAGLLSANGEEEQASNSMVQEDDLIIVLRQWASDGRSLKWGDIARQNTELAMKLKHRFGSWRRALNAARPAPKGVTAGQRKRWSSEVVIQAIEERQRTDQPVDYTTVRQEAQALISAARRCFGNWTAALKAAKVSVSGEKCPKQ